MTRLTELELGGNQLTGPIPSALGRLASLVWLDLDNNQLTGTIPSSFTNLGAMEGLSFYLNLGLCAQEDAAIQIWLSRIDEVLGPDCSPSVRLSVNPSRLVEGSGPTPVTVTATHAAVSSPTIVSLFSRWLGEARSRPGLRARQNVGRGRFFIEDALTIPAFAARGSAILTFTPLDDSSVEGEENIIVQAYVERGGKVEGSAILTLSDVPETGPTTPPAGPTTPPAGPTTPPAWLQPTTDWTITTFAGNGERGWGGDGGPAVEARLARPTGVAVDDAGNVYIADQPSHRIRKVDATGTITTVAGMGRKASAVTTVRLSRPS